MRRPQMRQLFTELDSEIRELESFVANPAHYSTERALNYLEKLRDVRKRLVYWVQPDSCSCSRGGNAVTCECQTWPDVEAQRLLQTAGMSEPEAGKVVPIR